MKTSRNMVHCVDSSLFGHIVIDIDFVYLLNMLTKD